MSPLTKVLKAILILVLSAITSSTMCEVLEGNKIKSPVYTGTHQESGLYAFHLTEGIFTV